MKDVWVLQSLEGGGLVELTGVFEDLEEAKHFLEDRYPFLQEWKLCPCEENCGVWGSWTGKHNVIIEKSRLYNSNG